MPARKLKEFLDANHVEFQSIPHSTAYTAQQVAEMAHVTGKELAKTVIVKMDDKYAMAVLPSNRKVVLQDLREETGIDHITFASEKEFKDLFPDCDVGAMPPFGNLYGMEEFVAPSLARNVEIAFSAGTHDEVVKMTYKDFERLAHPRVMNFTT